MNHTPFATKGGCHETAVRTPVIIWRRRHRDDHLEGTSAHVLGSVTRRAHAEKRPGRRHGFSASSHHPQFQFVRPLPGARAIGRRAASSSCSSATLNHAQMYGDRRAGARSWGQCDRHAPVRVNLFHGQETGLLKLGAGFGRRPFSADGRGCSPAIAVNIKSTRCGISKRVSQRLPRHLKTSVLLRPNRSNTGGQTIGYRGQSERSHFA